MFVSAYLQCKYGIRFFLVNSYSWEWNLHLTPLDFVFGSRLSSSYLITDLFMLYLHYSYHIIWRVFNRTSIYLLLWIFRCEIVMVLLKCGSRWDISQVMQLPDRLSIYEKTLLTHKKLNHPPIKFSILRRHMLIIVTTLWNFWVINCLVVFF